MKILDIEVYTPCDVRMMGEDSWMLLKDFRWTIVTNNEKTNTLSYHENTATAGFLTDFASIPRTLQWICPKGRAEKIPALIHDYYCRNAKTIEDREFADEVFLFALSGITVPIPNLHQDTNWPEVTYITCLVRRTAMYQAVTLRTKRLKYFGNGEVN